MEKNFFLIEILRVYTLDNKFFDMYIDPEEGVLLREKLRVRNYPNTKEKNIILRQKLQALKGNLKNQI